MNKKGATGEYVVYIALAVIVIAIIIISLTDVGRRFWNQINPFVGPENVKNEYSSCLSACASREGAVLSDKVSVPDWCTRERVVIYVSAGKKKKITLTCNSWDSTKDIKGAYLDAELQITNFRGDCGVYPISCKKCEEIGVSKDGTGKVCDEGKCSEENKMEGFFPDVEEGKVCCKTECTSIQPPPPQTPPPAEIPRGEVAPE